MDAVLEIVEETVVRLLVAFVPITVPFEVLVSWRVGVVAAPLEIEVFPPAEKEVALPPGSEKGD